ncbi:Multicopper oxidase type 2, partial [Penicillium concentricum]
CARWQHALDGNMRSMIFMNDQFPGPELRLEQGDNVEVGIIRGGIVQRKRKHINCPWFVVHNHRPFNTIIHFHGIEQLNTPWSDGVPGLPQKPFQRGHSWTCRWTATQYDTYWYHAHARGDMSHGLYGPIWISPAPDVISGFAKMKYKGSQDTTASQLYVDYSGRNTSASVHALDNKSMRNHPAVTIPKTSDQLANLAISHLGPSYTWATSGSGLYDVMANWDDPILYDINTKNNLEAQVAIQTKNGTWVNLLLQLGEMPSSPAIQAPHMMHKRSNKGFILGVGPGLFRWSSNEEAYAERPKLFQLERTTILFHCHIHTHMANGMAVALLDGVDARPQVPEEARIPLVFYYYY